jgi:hypothetical protein
MPYGCHHDPHIEGKLIGIALLEELRFEEHAGPLAGFTPFTPLL